MNAPEAPRSILAVRSGRPGLPHEFRRHLSNAPIACLLTDFDGTLAPHRVQREEARPSLEVLAHLAAIQGAPRSRIVIVTGREAETAARLLSPFHPDEIWGVHGLEHHRRNGERTHKEVGRAHQAGLRRAGSALEALGLGSRLEWKHGALALHWRGLDDTEVRQMRLQAEPILRRHARETPLLYMPFDGGIELRAPGPQKGGVVREVVSRLPLGSVVACLGDDSSDEDAFQALRGLTKPIHRLGLLVRPCWRPTAADVWIRPPGELLAFLQDWSRALREIP